ncbi:unnamed protein product [Brachionus calyciflorus]|uniref:EGF-like domain-containing protein n=1 Tax=Brachionus calyciflorus TaxID=104777 RepID=A0A813P0F1_9BILA|nr:unnamed protein product [Brachionus calyciflorus]
MKIFLFLQEGNCVFGAPEGSYKSIINDHRGFINIIKICDQKCATCTSETECTKCKEGYHLFGHKCINDCKPGFYTTEDGCAKCEFPCETCVNSTSCSSCSSNKILFESQCLDNCPLNYYQHDAFTCKPCHPSCETCRSGEKAACITCSHGFTFKGAECRSDCPDGTFYDKNEQVCSLCNTTLCSSCIKTPNTCTKCLNSFALDLGSNTCKPCCSRALRGKIKYPACCNCASNDPTLCSNEPFIEDSESIINVLHVSKKTALDIFIILLFVVSIFLIIYSIIYFVKSLNLSTPRPKNFNSVQYTPLDDL